MSLTLTPWRVKKLDDGSFAYLVPEAEVRTDARKMVAHVVVSTPTLDRERDVMVPRGCRTKSHQKNPIVLLNHQKNLPGIARTVDPDGNYTVRVTDEDVRASNYFDQGSKMAVQAFRAVESGALGGISPGFLTVPNCVHKVKAKDGYEAAMYSEWDLLEISHCPIGMNPDAIVLAVEKGFGGEALCPELKELLLPFVPEKKAMVTGGWEPAAKLLDELEAEELAGGDDLSPDDLILTPSTKMYHSAYEMAKSFVGFVDNLRREQELGAAKADAAKITGYLGAIMELCRQGQAGHAKAFVDQPGVPEADEANEGQMRDYRVKAVEAWNEYRESLQRHVASEDATIVHAAVEYLNTIAADKTLRYGIRSTAKRKALDLAAVRMVQPQADRTEAAELAALDKVLEDAKANLTALKRQSAGAA